MAKRTSPRTVGRPPGERARETESNILDAAEQIFARVGFNGARTQEIADASGVTKAMIHYYFDSKERLYRAVLDRVLFELIKLVQESTNPKATRVERLDKFVRGFFDYVSRHPHFGRLTFMGTGDDADYFDSIVTTFFRPLFTQGIRFIEEGVEEGVFRKVDAPQLLLTIYAAAMGYFADSHFIGLVLDKNPLAAPLLEGRRNALLDMIFSTLGGTKRP